VKDCERALAKWNRTLEASGLAVRLSLPSRRFHRHIGPFAGQPFAPDGTLLDSATFEKNRSDWLPTDADRSFVRSLMKAVTERGKFAPWIAPPAKGINAQPLDFEYVRRTSANA
jgi:benzoyl-CoA 2,3-dioxygenase component B